MPGEIPIESLAIRKQLLVAESNLNRARLIEELGHSRPFGLAAVASLFSGVEKITGWGIILKLAGLFSKFRKHP